jgi:galactose mutarotase-like enzyme
MKLETSNVSLVVSTDGAQMLSLFYKPTQKEWVWSGDKQFWPQHNPILFPIVGSTFDGKIRLEASVTEMGNHGFTRYSEFQVIEHNSNHIKLLLEDNEQTYQQYPFNFKLWVDYVLHGSTVEIFYRIENHSSTMMPFNFGLHPAFSTKSDGVSESIEIEFACPEGDVPQQALKAEYPSSVFLKDAFFEAFPTWIIEAPKSPHVTLKEAGSCLRVHVQGYRWLAFWKKLGARFICIEPWHSHDDFDEKPQMFKDREGTLWLDPKRSFLSSIKIELHQEDTHD